VYVPHSFDGLNEMVRASAASGDWHLRLLPAGAEVHGVTRALRSEFPGADQEELEYLAMTAAAQRAVEMVDPEGPYGRVVLAADVDSVEPADSEDPTAVLVAGHLVLSDVVSVHVDSKDAAPDVWAARSSLSQEATDAGERLERCLDHELEWYAAGELDQLVQRTAESPWRSAT
jgi:hypothetical protein